MNRPMDQKLRETLAALPKSDAPAVHAFFVSRYGDDAVSPIGALLRPHIPDLPFLENKALAPIINRLEGQPPIHPIALIAKSLVIKSVDGRRPNRDALLFSLRIAELAFDRIGFGLVGLKLPPKFTKPGELRVAPRSPEEQRIIRSASAEDQSWLAWRIQRFGSGQVGMHQVVAKPLALDDHDPVKFKSAIDLVFAT